MKRSEGEDCIPNREFDLEKSGEEIDSLLLSQELSQELRSSQYPSSTAQRPFMAYFLWMFHIVLLCSSATMFFAAIRLRGASSLSCLQKHSEFCKSVC